MGERSLDSRAALVTGGATGIGAAISRRLAAMGARVCVHQRSHAKGKRVVDELQRSGAEAASVAADLTTLGGCRAAVDACRERFGGVDILVNNAAVTGPRAVSPLLDLSDEKAGEILAVNLQAPLRCAQRAAEFMQRGVIVNVGSVAGHAAQPDELLVGDRSLRHI